MITKFGLIATASAALNQQCTEDHGKEEALCTYDCERARLDCSIQVNFQLCV